MAAQSSDTSAEDLVCSYDIDAPLTYEQMCAERARDREAAMAPHASSDEVNPYVFNDAPVDHCAFALASVARPCQHDGEQLLLKVRGVFASTEDAMRHAEGCDSEGCTTFVMEMYKFCVMPPSAPLMALAESERDEKLNIALRCYAEHVSSRHDFNERKAKMMEAIAKLETDKKRVQDGEMEEKDLDSSCICPEPVVDVMPLQDPTMHDRKMRGDEPANSYDHVVLCIADLAGVEGVPSELAGSVVVKLGAAFRGQEKADGHAQKLRKQLRYRHHDVYVANLYEWLACPPDAALLPNVTYEQKKLTEAIGQRNFGASEIMEGMLASDPMEATEE